MIFLKKKIIKLENLNKTILSTSELLSYKKLYYPAAGDDIAVLLKLFAVFPSINKVLYCSYYYSNEKNRDSAGISMMNLKTMFKGSSPILTKLQCKELPYNGKYLLDAHKVKISEIFTLDELAKTFYLKIISCNLYSYSPKNIKGPMIHIVKVPGDFGLKSFEEEFYPWIITNMKVGDLLLINYAALPLYKSNYFNIGLEPIELAQLNTNIPVTNIYKKDGIQYKGNFIFIKRGWYSFRKIHEISINDLWAIWLKDHDITSKHTELIIPR